MRLYSQGTAIVIIDLNVAVLCNLIDLFFFVILCPLAVIDGCKYSSHLAAHVETPVQYGAYNSVVTVHIFVFFYLVISWRITVTSVQQFG